ncbi:MAG TPA: hypothetical protein VIN59_00775 [Alphaproteobacteria bacterium]
MRKYLVLLSLILCLGGSAVLAAPQPIEDVRDVKRPPTTRAIVTLSQDRGDMRALMFGNVHSLKSCLGLAVAATKQGWKESSATCLDPQGRAVAAYFCDKKKDATRCRIGLPEL